jgi:hypothetical protein
VSTDPRETAAALARLATDAGAAEGEARNAALALARLVKEHGLLDVGGGGSAYDFILDAVRDMGATHRAGYESGYADGLCAGREQVAAEKLRKPTSDSGFVDDWDHVPDPPPDVAARSTA